MTWGTWPWLHERARRDGIRIEVTPGERASLYTTTAISEHLCDIFVDDIVDADAILRRITAQALKCFAGSLCD
jgi:hypothetical protein